MRADLYDRLQKLPVSFHDRWSAGQLMSRAVSDLSTIRRFLGFGVVFLFVNLTAFVVGVVILLALSWQLGVIIAALALPLVALCYLYESKYQVLARRSQDQVGDLATMVEESVLGIRILKAFGRSAHLSRRFLAQARELRATEIGKARVISALWAVIIALPEIAFGLTLFLGIRQVADGAHVGGHAGRLLRGGARSALADRLDRLAAGHVQRRGQRLAAILRGDGRSRSPSPRPSSPAPPSAPRAVGCSSAGVHFRFADAPEDAPRPAARDRSRRRCPARPWPSSAPPGPARQP